MTKYHYVYRITNIEENKHYYGVRSSKSEPKLDLGVKYFSSSTDKLFISEQKENRSIFKYKIIKQFNSRIDAINLEIKLHNKFDVGVNDNFYNVSKQTSVGFDRSGISFKHSEDTKLKIGLAHKAKTVTEETRMKLSDLHKGKVISQEHREKISKTAKGVAKSTEHKQLISNALKGKSKQTYICPHCNKEGKSGCMFRWHFNNCRLISEEKPTQ